MCIRDRTWGVFPDKSKQGGGPLIDIGTHALDITLWCMDNYKPATVTGSVFEKLGHLPEATEGNMFGPWDPETYEVEDSAFGYIKMENGATIFLESSWALNVKDSREAATTLCGTKAGAEMIGGMSQQGYDLVFNETTGGVLTEEHISDTGAIAFFEGNSGGSPEVKAVSYTHLDVYKRQLEVVAKNVIILLLAAGHQIALALVNQAVTHAAQKFERVVHRLVNQILGQKSAATVCNAATRVVIIADPVGRHPQTQHVHLTPQLFNLFCEDVYKRQAAVMVR